MTRDHDLESCSLWLQVYPGQIVQYVNRRTIKFDNFRLWKPASPGAFIDVAADRGERRECGEFFENFGIADIASMNNMVRATQCSQRFRPEQSVRVGDNSNMNGGQRFRFLLIS